MAAPPPPDEFPDKVLVVDDEEHARDLLDRILTQRSLVTEVASTGEEAVLVLERLPVACVVADKNLPGMSGLEVIQRAGELQPHCARILVTGYASKESAIAALRAGADEYLEKPFDSVSSVGETIERAIKERRVRFEHDRLTRRLHEAHRTLAARDREIQLMRTESELFDEVIALREREAVDRALSEVAAELDALRERLQVEATSSNLTSATARVALKRACMLIEKQAGELGKRRR